MTAGDGGHVLVICEKPDAARRVSDALSDGTAKASVVDGVSSFRFSRGGSEYVVCSAQGHVYSVSDPLEERTVYPVFDVEWYPSDEVDDGRTGASRRISAVKKLAEGATTFVNACDLDAEGETIGFNLLRYACRGREAEALRAKFSTLTKEELVRAFEEAGPQESQGLASAGRARHMADFVWGVNLSRMLSRASTATEGRFRTVTVGRVQGPTMGFLTEREREIREFVPVPFWKVEGEFEADGRKFTAPLSRRTLDVKAEAEAVRRECLGKEGSVAHVSRTAFRVAAPPPFNIGDLQKESYRHFHLTPSRTLQAAERLYLDALISYPRTGSQRLPPVIGYRRIIEGLGRDPAFSREASELLKGDLRPSQGGKDDPAHPAIHPTGEKVRGRLGSAEASVYDLVVRRFLAAFGPPATRETVNAAIDVGPHRFELAGSRTLSLGWIAYYGKYSGFRDAELPKLSGGDRLKVRGVDVSEGRQKRPDRYNQSSLLEEMERQKIGTKATRADVISTLIARGYVAGESMQVTDLGLSLMETLEKHSPSIVTTALTRGIEERLEEIESGKEGTGPLVRETVRSIARSLLELRENEDSIGSSIGSAAGAAVSAESALGPCPVCKTGQLRVVKSRSSGKRFVGCSNYRTGCRASAPLPQRGSIRASKAPCVHCSWPVVYVTSGRRPWKLCVNMACPGKKK